MSRSDDELLKVSLGENSGMDVIKLEDRILFVLSERSDIQKRYVAEVTRRQGLEIAKFIVGWKKPEDRDE